MNPLAKILIVCGAILILVGLVVQYFDRLPLIGKLPGDIVIERDNFKIYIPVTTSILLSILLTVFLYLVGRFKN